MVEDIRQWLAADGLYDDGLLLLKQLGCSAVLLGVLAGGDSYFNRKKLRQLLTDGLPMEKPKPAIIRRQTSPENKKIAAPPKVYGRLKITDYPPELHAAFTRQDLLYRNVGHLHSQLELLHQINETKCREACQAIVKGWREINAIYRILDYWAENKIILPHKYTDAPEVDLSDRAELVRVRNVLRSRVSKHKNKPARHAEVEGWKQKIESLNARIADVV